MSRDRMKKQRTPVTVLEPSLTALLVVGAQRSIKLSRKILWGGSGIYGLPLVRYADAPFFDVHLNPVGQDSVPVHDYVLQDVAYCVVDGLLDLADPGACTIQDLVALHERIWVLTFHLTNLRVARTLLCAYDSRT